MLQSPPPSCSGVRVLAAFAAPNRTLPILTHAQAQFASRVAKMDDVKVSASLADNWETAPLLSAQKQI